MGGHAFWVWEELEEEYWVVRGIFCLSIRVFFHFSQMILMGLITSGGINTRISSQLGLWHLFFISLCRTLRDG
jgi:hypothetical protein